MWVRHKTEVRMGLTRRRHVNLRTPRDEHVLGAEPGGALLRDVGEPLRETFDVFGSGRLGSLVRAPACSTQNSRE